MLGMCRSIVIVLGLLSVMLLDDAPVARGGTPVKAEGPAIRVAGSDQVFNPYPVVYTKRPDVPSPFTTLDGTEVVVVCTKDSEYALVPATVENGPRDLPYGSRAIGKGRQLEVDANDFPALARTGLHSEEEMDRTESITGRRLEVINELGRPDRASGAGFMAVDEDILSVLKGDNRLVRRLELTHPLLARPLFHLWNLVLREYELGRIGRNSQDIESVLYNGLEVHFGQVHPTRGFQESIFNDEVMGAFDINFHRDLTEGEKALLETRYSGLEPGQRAELTDKLTHTLTSEMEPYYIMRYGFYEGHTAYRVDPIAISFIFGLRSLEEIEAAFPGRLYEVLTRHFTRDHLPNP